MSSVAHSIERIQQENAKVALGRVKTYVFKDTIFAAYGYGSISYTQAASNFKHLSDEGNDSIA